MRMFEQQFLDHTNCSPMWDSPPQTHNNSIYYCSHIMFILKIKKKTMYHFGKEQKFYTAVPILIKHYLGTAKYTVGEPRSDTNGPARLE